MKKLFETLEALKPQFIEGLNNQLFLYTTIGSGTDESPMWIQMDQVKDGVLKFVNSQKTGIGFRIPVDDETKELINTFRDECYDYFKYVKYSHIHEVTRTVWDELAIGYNGNRIQSFMDSYQPPVIQVKSRIEQLMESGQLTVEEVMEYAQKHMDGVDQYDDEQIDKYYQEEYNPEWLSNDPNAPDYYDTQDVEWPTHVRSSNPEYVIASTSNRLEETYVFESSSKGKILDMGEYGGIAKRFGDDNWKDHQNAVKVAMGHIPYRFEIEIPTGRDDVRHFLYSRIGSADYWDGE